ncbi:DEAD/DEAH box helicase [Flavobacterium magnum]|uniref:DEAD/DEAH box helicase n=1 Tax=Flavobacterium magnum TaxID=2162713 RepID=A0A2S0RGW8_9FLAO|nr:DEAD/DEAH box helicase [Flavobacterium magnum]AWA30914.1 DEAD/DEAH box helicase [Flavobacterium magnum]
MPKISTTLYPYQERDIAYLFRELETSTPDRRLLYQLPTGGGKTVIFSEIARRFIAKYSRKVAILTHRSELCSQTSATLTHFGVPNDVIESATKLPDLSSDCAIAMVETLKHRIKEGKISTADVGLVIIDEAHHNAFRKLLKKFRHSYVIGVTATPFSSDISKPMNAHYHALISGDSIADLIAGGFLAKPQSVAYDVELNSLTTGIHGDFTISSSNALYGSPAMLQLLLDAYHSHADGRKTLIFNNGIDTSLKVHAAFTEAGIPIRHLDNNTGAEDRKAILQWFRKTKGAVLTSVSILTTGFDEPTVQAVILNRATTSVTLYHQMIGRGARRLPAKKTFRIIDLGNNMKRFGDWDAPMDWQHVFENPAAYAAQLNYSATATAGESHRIPAEIRTQFPNTLEFAFDVAAHYEEAVEHHKKPKTVIQDSLRQQALMCLDNADTVTEALKLASALQPEIEWRVKSYVKCIGNASKSYKDWLLADYMQRLDTLIPKLYRLRNRQQNAV